MDPEKQIKDLEKQDLSGTDLLNMVDGRSNLLAYSQIHTSGSTQAN